MSKIIVYKAVDPHGKHYIGFTTKPLEKRKAKHQHESTYGCHYLFHRALIEFGFDQFKWEVIATTNNFNTARELEKRYIKEYNSFMPNGYNQTLGGGGSSGRPNSPETRAKISIRMKAMWSTPEGRLKNSLAQLNRKPMTDEARENYRLGQLKRDPSTRPTSEKLRENQKRCIIKCSNGVIYPSISEAARQLNVWNSHIILVLKGKRKHTGGYTFEIIERKKY
jgi:group I intron endonuclease